VGLDEDIVLGIDVVIIPCDATSSLWRCNFNGDDNRGCWPRDSTTQARVHCGDLEYVLKLSSGSLVGSGFKETSSTLAMVRGRSLTASLTALAAVSSSAARHRLLTVNRPVPRFYPRLAGKLRTAGTRHSNRSNVKKQPKRCKKTY
jgi:hypothetical protein